MALEQFETWQIVVSFVALAVFFALGSDALNRLDDKGKELTGARYGIYLIIQLIGFLVAYFSIALEKVG